MDITLTDYIFKVKSHLYCNLTNNERMVEVSYDYTDDDIDKNVDYFCDCLNEGLSPYKALLFFYDYLTSKNYELGTKRSCY